MLTVPFVLYLSFKLFIHEEEYLENKFGDQFLDYKSTVNELFPF